MTNNDLTYLEYSQRVQEIRDALGLGPRTHLLRFGPAPASSRYDKYGNPHEISENAKRRAEKGWF